MTSLEEKIAQEYGRDTFAPVIQWERGYQEAKRHLGVYRHIEAEHFFVFLEGEEEAVLVSDEDRLESAFSLALAIAIFAHADKVEQKHGLGATDVYQGK